MLGDLPKGTALPFAERVGIDGQGCAWRQVVYEDAEQAWVSTEDTMFSLGGSQLFDYSVLKDGTARINLFGEDALNGTELVIPETLDGHVVSSIGSRAFPGCKSIMSVILPNALTSIGDSAFDDCCNLTSIVLPNTLESVGNYAFDECYNLTDVNLPASLANIGDEAFSKCFNLTFTVVDDSYGQQYCIDHNLSMYC